ncbi:MAG: FKBP-type peptidyl-prolyl cis-trans isomerase [Bacteroidales bacterium]|nr:FKBP-type peptidyl-prolyl cis-trans isomerase [Bacteroidales bacterium]
MKKIFKAACLMIAVLGLAACTQKQKAEKVTLANETDSVSYAFGMQQGKYIADFMLNEKNQSYANSFIKAFRTNFRELNPQEEFENSVLTFGFQVGSDIEKGFFQGDSTFTLSRTVLVENILKGMKGEFTEEEIDQFQNQFQRLMMDRTLRSAEHLDSMNVAFGALNGNSVKSYIEMTQKDTANKFNPMAVAEKKFKEGLKNAGKETYEAKLQGMTVAGQLFGMLKQMPNLQIEDFICNADMVKAGVINAMVGDSTIFTADEASAFYNEFADNRHKAKLEFEYGSNRTAGEEFLAANKEEDGVITTESGLQYKVIKMGKGQIPTAQDRVKVHYTGKLLDGTVFDSSVERGEPAEFGVTQVIAGWTEVLQLMPEGSKFQVFIPQELAYGDRDMGTIKPFSTLIFDIELLEILGDVKQNDLAVIK